MAPAAAVAFSIPFGIGFGGGATPLSVLLAVWMIAKAGSANTLSVFGTSHANNPDFKGFSGVVAASVYTILAFIGFEAAAPLAEETKDPRRTIGRAVVLSCVLIGLFY